MITVPEEAPLAEIARALEAHRIKRVPVVRDGRLVGIVSRADVLRGLASLHFARAQRPSADDRQIRDQILELLKKRSDASTRFVSVIVVGGTVYLWGIGRERAGPHRNRDRRGERGRGQGGARLPWVPARGVQRLVVVGRVFE